MLNGHLFGIISMKGGEIVDVNMTQHSIKRTKERIGISKKIAGKNAQKALDKGLTHAEAKGSLKRYIDALYLSERLANNIRVYHGYVYLFKGNTLITVIELPQKYRETAKKQLERKMLHDTCNR